MATMSVNVYPLELLKIGSFLCKDKTNDLQKKNHDRSCYKRKDNQRLTKKKG